MDSKDLEVFSCSKKAWPSRSSTPGTPLFFQLCAVQLFSSSTLGGRHLVRRRFGGGGRPDVQRAGAVVAARSVGHKVGHVMPRRRGGRAT